MTNAAIDENNCLVINQANFKDFNLHPLWLRERLSEPEFLDHNSYQRLYEPALIDQNIKIKNFSIDKKILTVTLYDGVDVSFILS